MVLNLLYILHTACTEISLTVWLTNGKGCSLLITGCCPGWWVKSNERFHLFGGGVLALLSAAACCGEGDVSLVGGWLDGKLGGELQYLIKFIVNVDVLC